MYKDNKVVVNVKIPVMLFNDFLDYGLILLIVLLRL